MHLQKLQKTWKNIFFCSFIDFSKAFDSVWRVGLWKKLLASNVNGKCIQIILNMYKGVKSCVSYNGEQSSFFSSFLGVRQDENLSPVLFALVLNDLETFLCDKSCNGIIFEFQYDDITLYLKLLVLLNADDTVVLVQMRRNFKNMFYEYSELWDLSINFDKTKIIIFGTRQDQGFNFNLGGHQIKLTSVLTLNILVLLLAETGTSTKQRNIMLSKLRRQCMYFSNEFVILIFQLICSCIYMTMLFHLLHYMVVKYWAL